MFVNFSKRQQNSNSLQIWLRWIGKWFPIVYLPAALLPAVWALSYPTPVVWLRLICKDTWPILAAAAMAAILPRLFRRAGASAWSLLVIALTQASFQASCYNTASHPAGNPFQMWGILPATDSGLYYSAASNLLNGKQITAMAGARHPYPLLLAVLCLAQMRQHPGKLLQGWWRALRFLWSKNTPFRSVYPKMPSLWFTESARWCTVLGLAFSLFFLIRGRRLASKFRVYQGLSWLNLATLLGMIASLPFAPPWDGETRIFAATPPLFFLLPASGIDAVYLSIFNGFHQLSLESNAESQLKLAIGSTVAIAGTLSIAIILGSWCWVGTGSAAKGGPQPVESMVDHLNVGGSSVSFFDLRSLKAGYHLHVIDDTQRTWLPNISRKDFIRNPPGRVYSYPSPTLKQLPPGTELVVLPYWVLLVLDKEDAHAQRFTPQPEQTGHVLWPPLYFSKPLHVEGR